LPPDRTSQTVRFAAARGFVDAVVLPDETRAAFVLPPNV
jgi:hypothetical protein